MKLVEQSANHFVFTKKVWASIPHQCNLPMAKDYDEGSEGFCGYCRKKYRLVVVPPFAGAPAYHYWKEVIDDERDGA